MKPADNGKRKYKCPFTLIDRFVTDACEREYSFGELVWHLQSMHPDSRLLAWIVAATWEDVCSGHEADCA